MTEGINRILDNPSVNALRVATSLYTREAYYPTKEHTMERVKGFFQHISLYIIALAKWLCIGGGVGLIGGVVGAAFHIGVEQATELRLAQPWIIWLLPVGGVVIVGLYRLAHMEGRGTNNIIESVHFGKDVPILLVPLIFISTCITHLLGGSAGREGAALQIGGGIGYRTGRALHLGEKDLPLATLCGMSAVFAALFGTPLTATVFALEVISVGVLYYAGLIPCLMAASVAYLIASLFGVSPTRFAVTLPALDVWTVFLVVLLAIGCALVSILFCKLMHGAGHLMKRIKNPWLRVICGGFAVTGAEFDGLIRSHNVDGGVVGHGKSACRDRLGNAGREKGLAQTSRAEQQQIGGILAEFCGISLAFAQIIFHIFARRNTAAAIRAGGVKAHVELGKVLIGNRQHRGKLLLEQLGVARLDALAGRTAGVAGVAAFWAQRLVCQIIGGKS